MSLLNNRRKSVVTRNQECSFLYEFWFFAVTMATNTVFLTTTLIPIFPKIPTVIFFKIITISFTRSLVLDQFLENSGMWNQIWYNITIHSHSINIWSKKTFLGIKPITNLCRRGALYASVPHSEIGPEFVVLRVSRPGDRLCDLLLVQQSNTEYDFHTGCRNVGHNQQQSFTGLHKRETPNGRNNVATKFSNGLDCKTVHSS